MDNTFDISRFMYAFSQTTLKIKILKEIPEYAVGNTTFGPYRSGSIIEIPRWQATALIEQEVAEPATSIILDLSILETVLLSEQQSSPLQALTPEFYMLLRTHLQEVRKQKIEKPEPKISTLEQRSKMLFTQILDLRLNKIFRLLSLENTQQFEKNMSKEEHWLFQQLHHHVLAFRSQILE